MTLNHYRIEAAEFLKRSGLKDEDCSIKIAMLEEELNILKKVTDNPAQLKHQIYDMLFLLFEIAADYEFDLEEEWNKGKIRKYEKYIAKTLDPSDK